MFYVFYLPNGDIMQQSKSMTAETATTLAAGMGLSYITTDEEPGRYDWVEGGELVSPPDSPSVNHVWNRQTRVWEFPLEEIYKAANERISAELIRRKNDIIAYDGFGLDADVRSQTNISNKITELDQSIFLGIETPSDTLIWRDADNTNHSFGSAQELKNWLGGLAVAIAQRGTLAYLWSWNQKAALATLIKNNDVAAILSFPDTST